MCLIQCFFCFEGAVCVCAVTVCYLTEWCTGVKATKPSSTFNVEEPIKFSLDIHIRIINMSIHWWWLSRLRSTALEHFHLHQCQIILSKLPYGVTFLFYELSSCCCSIATPALAPCLWSEMGAVSPVSLHWTSRCSQHSSVPLERSQSSSCHEGWGSHSTLLGGIVSELLCSLLCWPPKLWRMKTRGQDESPKASKGGHSSSKLTHQAAHVSSRAMLHWWRQTKDKQKQKIEKT